LTEGHHNLGVMYDTGKGAKQNYVRADMWFNIAAINWTKVAGVRIKMMEGKMTPQQIEQAQRMARECMVSSFAKCD